MTDAGAASPDPAGHGAPPGYGHWRGDRAEDHIGPFFFRMDGEHPRTAFRARERHCNAHDTVHGGVLMAFADYTLCLAANGGESESVATVSCGCEFVAPARAGELVLGAGEAVRRGRSMVFARCVLSVGDRTVMTASAVIKRIQNR